MDNSLKILQNSKFGIIKPFSPYSVTGCDQKHEEEMDPEAIYKNFVLRVSPKYCFISSNDMIYTWIKHLALLVYTGDGSKESQCKTSQGTEQKFVNVSAKAFVLILLPCIRECFC